MYVNTSKAQSPKSNGTRDCLRGGDPYGNGALVVVRAGESLVHGEGGQVVSTEYKREVLVMRTAETVLNVIRERGERGLPLENIYRLLYNRNLYLRAYGRLYSNQGAMTKGTTAETVDGMSLAKIDRIIDELRYGRCHRHNTPPDATDCNDTGEPDAVKAARPVRKGADGKVLR